MSPRKKPMYEKNIVGTYKIADRFPVFKHTTHEHPEIESLRRSQASSETKSTTANGLDLDPALRQWRDFSEHLKDQREQQQRREQAKAINPEALLAQEEVDLNIREHVQQLQQAAQTHLESQPSSPAPLQIEVPKLKAAHGLRQHLLIRRKQRKTLQAQSKANYQQRQAVLQEAHLQSPEHVGQVILSQVMTRNVIAIRDNASLIQAATLCQERGISGLPVVNSREQLVGVISLHDVIRELIDPEIIDSDSDFSHEPVLQQLVAQHMSTHVISAEASTTINQACQLMRSERIRRLIILDQHQIIGIFSARDALRVLAGIDLKIDRQD